MCRSSQYPTGWKETTLGDLAHYINGYAFRPEDWKKVGLPIIRIQQINDPEAEYDCFDGPIADQYRIDNGDLLFSWSATLTTLIWNRGPAVLNQHIFKVIPREGADLHFLHHLLEYLMDDLAGRTHGSTMRHIKRSDLLPFPVVVPLPEEQRCIAEILDAADEAIRQTERVIAKLKAVKAGLLHDLLTRGLDEHGHLRDPQAHPEQFKDSPLGRVPREWEVRTIAELGGRKPSTVQTGPFGAQLHSEDYVDEGVPFILIRNLQEGGLDTSDMPHITYRDAQRLSLYALEPGDIVFSRVGRVGSCFLVEEEQAGWVISGQMLRIRLPHDVVDHRYLVHALRSKQAQDQITGASVGTTRQSINTQILESLRILVPSVVEQRRIAAVLDAHDARIRAEEAELAKLRQIKRGLMDDLLMGKVRVRV